MYSFIDIILILLMALIVFRSWKKGLFSSIMRIVSFVISGIASFILYAPLANFLNEKFVLTPVVNATRNKISSLSSDGDIEKLFVEMPESFRSFLHGFGYNPDSVSSEFVLTDLSPASFAEKLANDIGASVASLISSALAILILFIGCMLALTLISSIINNLIRSSVINMVNKLLGLLFGLLSALIFGWVISNGIIMLTGGLRLFFPDAFSIEALESSKIITFFAQFNPFNF